MPRASTFKPGDIIQSRGWTLLIVGSYGDRNKHRAVCITSNTHSNDFKDVGPVEDLISDYTLVHASIELPPEPCE